MKNCMKLFVCLMFCFSNTVFAQGEVSRGNVEALENINLSLDRIENAITSLTSQNEQNVYNQKNAKAEMDVVLKDLKLQIKEVKDEQEKISKDVYAQKVEVENLKNIVAMLQEKLVSVEKKDIVTEKKNVEEKTSEKATKNPTALLVGGDEKEDKSSKLSDDESFRLAIENFDKKDFTESAINFASNLKNFPEGKNFYKNLLYLGRSMNKLDNKNGACTAFAKIINSSEDIAPDLKSEALKEFKQLECIPAKVDEKKEVRNNAV